MKRITALLLLISAIFAHPGCIHDTLDVPLTYADDDSDLIDVSHGQRVLASTYQSIRIYADYTYLTSGNSILKEYIQNQLMPSAISYYQSVLSVIRSTTNIKFSTTCGGLTPPAYITNTGVAADLVILVTADYSTDSYLAYALPCGLNKGNDRPVYGMINFNYNYLFTASNVNLEENLITTLHEMAHILGFSANLYSLYINPTTNAKINPLAMKSVGGRTVQYLKAEPLLSRVKAYFDCSTALGAYLENQGASGSAGSHFERKIFGNEFMTASSITDSVISEFTLALLESTGWYKASYTMVEPFTWGKKKGCTFLIDKCLTTDLTPAFDEFCSPLQSEGCTFSSRAVGVCGASDINTNANLLSIFNYWGNKTVVLDGFSDNCPYYLGYPTLDCEDPANKDNGLLSIETYGTSSRCFSGTLSAGDSPRKRTGFCFATQCSTNNGAPVVTITYDGTTVTCESAGTISIPGYQGTLECPDPATFCARANPVYCERGCSGRGTCGADGKCVCPSGWTGADCGLRTYVDGCSKCASQTINKSCFGDLCACNPMLGSCPGYALIGTGDGGIEREDDSQATGGMRVVVNIVGLIAVVMLYLFE